MKVLSKPLISVCIPSFNRPDFIDDLLETIVRQDFTDYEIVVSEDDSPKTIEVETVVTKYVNNYPDISIRFIRNEETLGYDGNFRSLLNISHGIYCVFMGDDDLLNPGALSKISKVINANKNLGVILRTWARAKRESKEVIEVHKYFDSDRLFKKGVDSISTLFRRSVAIAGYTVNRELAIKYNTDKFDGTLLYQLYITGVVTSVADGFYIADTIATMRKDEDLNPTHFFGTAKAEQGLFEPGKLGIENSVNFVRGMVEIAKYLDKSLNIPGLYKKIRSDIGNYSYPILSLHVNKRIKVFYVYYRKLSKLGLGHNLLFHVYFFALLIFKRKGCDWIIRNIKSSLNRTPFIGGLHQGDKI